MRRRPAVKNGKCSGFAVVEMLVVVAMLAILAAMAIPNIMQSRKDLHLYELDGIAREIFLTAQNDLTDAKASSRLTQLAGPGSAVAKDSSTGSTLHYITSATASATLSQLAGLGSTLPGSFVVYLAPASGDITDVYYSNSDLTHADVMALRRELGGTDDPALREKRGIGYYGGLRAVSPVPTDKPQTPGTEVLELVNGEDLFLKLKYPALLGAYANPAQVQAEITLRDESENQVILRADGSTSAAANVYARVDTDQSYTLYVLLDSLTEGCSFVTLFPELTAGDNITVSASLSYNGRTIYKDAPVGTVNSLFAAKYSSDVTSGGIAHKKGVELSRVRHLSNLRYYSGGAAHAVQMGHIDFQIYYDVNTLSGTDKDNVIAQRQKVMLPAAVKHWDRIPGVFQPIPLTQEGQRGLTLDGQGAATTPYTLRNFFIAQDTGSLGLIGNADVPASFQNLRLIDIRAQGPASTGALVGTLTAEGTVFTNCGVYRTSNSAAAFIKGRGATGGLLGTVSAANVELDACFSAISVTGLVNNQPAGGLIGRVSSGSVVIKNAYASGDVFAQGAAGGLLGACSGTVRVENCFSSSDVKTAGTAGGALAGQNAGTLAVTNSYACGIVTRGGTPTYGPLVGGNGASFVNTRYLSQSGNVTVKDAGNLPQGVTALEYAALAAGISNPLSKCHPYRPALAGKAYPFFMVSKEYYGDWPEKLQPVVTEGLPYGLCYFEEYTDGTWGFYGNAKDVTSKNDWKKIADSLDYVNAKTIKQAGYGVLVPDTTTASAVKAPKISWKPEAKLKDMVAVTALGQHLYPLADVRELVNHINQIDLGIIDQQSGRTFYINPLFAGAMSLDTLKTGSQWNGEDNPVPLQIRTEEHLRNLGEIPDGGWYFKQSHNITVTNASTGGYYLRSHIYEGGENTIFGLRKHLFGTNEGEVRNLTLADVQIQNSGSVAALVDYNNNGIIENCHVLSGTIQNDSGNAAGLVRFGETGTIRNSTVSSDVTVKGARASGFVDSVGGAAIENSSSEATVTGVFSAAGFAREVLYGSARLTQCYTRGMVTSSAGSASGFVAQFTGGLIQFSYSNNIVSGVDRSAGFCLVMGDSKIENSFSVGNVSAQNGTAAGFVEHASAWGSMIKNSYAAVQLSSPVSRVGFLARTEYNDMRGVQNCIWVGYDGFNPGVTNPINAPGKVEAVTFEALKSWPLASDPNSGWVIDNDPNKFPYPRIKGLEFYGSWPS